MKFDYRQFSKRFPAIECAVFVIHEPPQRLTACLRVEIDAAKKRAVAR